MTTNAHRSLAALLPLALACGPGLTVPTEGTDGAGETASSSTAAPPSTDDAGPIEGTTEALDSTGQPPSTSTASFLDDIDAGGGSNECDIFAQDCPPGQKCMPWANDGGSSWNATRCTPIAEDPGEPGDPCMVEGSGVSGIDDCELGALCWNVDPETNEGSCVAMCTGGFDHLVCEDPDTYCVVTAEGVLLPCLPSCDPLAQDCAEGQGCYPFVENWGCSPDASGDMGVFGDPCEFVNVCDPGLICVNAALVPDCEGGLGCCTEVCDLSAPVCTGAGQECLPWHEDGDAPIGYENVGACLLPRSP